MHYKVFLIYFYNFTHFFTPKTNLITYINKNKKIMKKLSVLVLVVLICFVGIAQETTSINWLTIKQLERAVKKKKKNCFIFIEDDRIDKEDAIPKEELELMKKHMFGFLEDAELIKYLNDNFNCYKFDPSSESLKFQGKEYKRLESKGRISNKFTSFLTEDNANRLPIIVIRNKDFQLFEYKKALPKTEELKVLLEAEKLKLNYIKEKFGENSKHLEESTHFIKKKARMLKKEEINKDKKNKSVLKGRQNAKRLLKTLNYFVSGAYQNTDLENYSMTTN